jgi:peptidoglycan/LPS O-acetylase OafA/YrhL
MKRFLVLDSFRGLCALALVAHHARALQSFSEWPLLRNANHFTELFLALCGFLLYRKYMGRLESREQLRHFVIARICRVYPLHAVMLLVFIGFECLKLLLTRYGIALPNAPFTGDRALSEIVPNLLLVQAWWPGFNPLSFNYPAWFVSVELYLSLLFGVIAMTLPLQARKLFVLIAVAAFMALHWHDDLLSVQVLTGLGCFFAGGVTYRLYIRLQDLLLGPLLASLLEVGILGLIYWVMAETEAPSIIDLSLLFCIALLIFAFEEGLISRVLRHSMFVSLGQRWFSIYMTHAAVIVATTLGLTLLARSTGHRLLRELPDPLTGTLVRFIDSGSELNDNLLMVFQMVAVIVVSMLTYRFIEKPGIALGRRWSQGRAGSRDNAAVGSQANNLR